MKGKGPMDTQDLVLELTTEMLHLAFPERRTSDIRSKLMADLASGQALDAFKRVITAQGGDCRFVDDPSAMGSARYHTTIEAECSGYLEKIDVQQLGYGIISLGGGRTHKDQQIDTTVGLSGLQRQGCWFDAGEALCTIHANSQEANQTALRQIKQAFIVGEKHRVDTLIRTTM